MIRSVVMGGFFCIICALSGWPGAQEPAPTPVPPRGIYALDDHKGTFRDANLRDYDFVTGYAWRRRWADLEPEKDRYDFEAFDHIANRLKPLGQKLSYGLWSPFGWPSYLNEEPGVTTWTYRHGVGQPFEQSFAMPVPWDPYLQSRFAAFLDALSVHPIDGTALREHELLSNLVFMVPGLGFGPIREQGNEWETAMPGYTRQKLVMEGILPALRAVVGRFPNTFVSVPLYSVTDQVAVPALWEEIQSKIQAEFGARVGIWHDDLGAGFPAAGADPVLRGINGILPIQFQMIGSWSGSGGIPQSQGDPIQALRHAYETFGTTYFEVYASDLDRGEWAASFREWAATLRPNQAPEVHSPPWADPASVILR